MPNIHRSQLHDSIITTAKVLDGAITASKLSGTAVTTSAIAPVALAAWTPYVSYTLDLADAAGDTDIVLPFKFELLEVQVIKTGANGGAGDTMTVKNGATAISNAISLNLVNKVTAWAGAIDTAQSTIAKAGTLRLTLAKVTNCACRVTLAGSIRA
jgi:hypothetical protein